MSGFDLATSWVLLLLPLPLLVALWRRRGGGVAVGPRLTAAMRERLGGETAARRPPSRAALARWLAWLLLVVALSGPRTVMTTPALPATGREIMFALDLSGSMIAPDMLDGGKPITRIDLLKKVGAEMIKRLAGNRVGVVIFAERALAAAPLSFDAEGVARILKQQEIGLVGRSTAIGDGLGLAVKRLSEIKAPTKVIVLLSDGSTNAGTMDPMGVAKLAHSLGIRIYTIGFGPNETLTPEDDPDSVDFVALQKLAKEGDGQAFRARNGEEFAADARELEKLIAGETTAPPAVLHHDYWPLPAAAGMLVAFAMTAAGRRPR